MLDASVIQVLVIMGLPYLIKAVRSFFAKAPPPSPLRKSKPPPPNKWNNAMIIVLALAGVYHTFSAVLYNPPNIFKTLSLPPDCPNFILHQSWKEQASLDPNFMTKYPDSMRERFKANENRLLYEIFGQEAFLDCDHCVDRSDYFMYIVPGIVASYVGMAIILGMATTNVSHLTKYRTWGTATMVIMSLVEYGAISKGTDLVNLNQLQTLSAFAGVGGAHMLRHGVFALMSIVVAGLLHRAKNGNEPRDEVDILNDLCQAQEAMIQRHRALQLARVASLRDPLLRKQFVEYWKRREVEHGLLLSDVEYKEARDLALSRIDVETITKEADQYIETIIKAGSRSPSEGEDLTKIGQDMTN